MTFDLLIQFTLIIAFIVIANLIARSGENRYRRLFDKFFLLLSLPILAAGIFFVLMPDSQIMEMEVQPGVPAFAFVTNPTLFGVMLQLLALWGIVFSFYSTRESLAKYVPVNPDSAVHTLALVWAGWLAGGTLIQVTQVNLEEIIEAIGTLDVTSIVLQQAFFVLLAFLGVGWLIRRPSADTLARLGLGRIHGRELIIGMGWILFLVVFQAMMGTMWAVLDPDQALTVNELNIELQSGLDTFWEWLILAIAAGVGEEILFRGALQKVFGLWFTSFLFALVHVQYGLFTPATLALFIIGFSLGMIRRRYNTSLAVFVHFGYDFTLGMIALLVANYLPT